MRSSQLQTGRRVNVPVISDSHLIARPRDVIAAVTKRLAHRNANVQLYSLTVSNLPCADMS